MIPVLLDTHAWAWSLTADQRLSAAAVDAMGQAETACVGAISFFEIGQKVRIGKWPEMVPFVDRLVSIADVPGACVVDLSLDIALLAAGMEWDHRDPFDRIIAATAIVRGLALVSADVVFDTLPSFPKWRGRIW